MIIFEGTDEFIVCETKNRKKAIKEYFFKESGRDFEEYEESETASFTVSIPMLRVETLEYKRKI